ncbi:thioredoxin domain-containing protein [Herbiconiux liukaitaii]|uniref:thioredoxin domain-containing protein n=1 Tax=Herbiconiux liukaitaii TaxID=3342799 RepID=UPI0035B83CCF
MTTSENPRNHLGDAVSPYLRSHAGNPVDWFPWGEAAFDEARRRGVPLLVSIGYSTCHWCHVMARESFADPLLAAQLNERFVAIKVDREEHPEVDSVYLTAAGAFTRNLGWPLNVFVTPEGRAFYAGTYWPPVAVDGHPAFADVLDAVHEAWTERHDEVLDTADRLAAAIAASTSVATREQGPADSGAAAEAGAAGVAGATADAGFSAVIDELLGYEDAEFGGFGSAPKFPVAPVLGFLLGSGEDRAVQLAQRTLTTMAASELRDPVEGGFFRYSTQRDWSDPHYERMLYDNALLLDAYTTAWAQTGQDVLREAAEGIAHFLLTVLQLPSGGFASAQDSESTVDGRRVEGGYYRLDAAARAEQTPPALDEKVLAGWNGLAIGALAHAALVFDRPTWTLAAQHAADHLLAVHVLPTPPAAVDGTGEHTLPTPPAAGDGNGENEPPAPPAPPGARGGDGGGAPSGVSRSGSPAPTDSHAPGSSGGGGVRLVRASIEGRLSSAASTPEDYGMLAEGLLRLASTTGSLRYAEAGRMLVEALAAAGFRAPGGGDPLLAAQGMLVELDPSEGAYPSGTSATAGALLLLHGLTGERRHREAARALLAPLAAQAAAQPISFGRTLELLSSLSRPAEQLVLIEPDPTTDPAELIEPDPTTDPTELAGPDSAAHPAESPEPAGAATRDTAVDEDHARSEAEVPREGDTASEAEALREAVRRRTGALVARAGETEARLLADAGFELFAERTARGSRPTAYLCLDFVCRLPTTTARDLAPTPRAASDPGAIVHDHPHPHPHAASDPDGGPGATVHSP